MRPALLTLNSYMARPTPHFPHPENRLASFPPFHREVQPLQVPHCPPLCLQVRVHHLLIPSSCCPGIRATNPPILFPDTPLLSLLAPHGLTSQGCAEKEKSQITSRTLWFFLWGIFKATRAFPREAHGARVPIRDGHMQSQCHPP